MSIHIFIYYFQIDINIFVKYFLISVGVGIGVVFGCLLLSYARNPSLKQQLFSYAILGFALAEAMGLMCIMVTFLLLFGV